MTDNERFAPLFGFENIDYIPFEDRAGRKWRDENRTLYHECPDFCDIRERFFGPACEELGKAGWVLLLDPVNRRWNWESRVDYSLAITDENLGRCTMLALEKQLRSEK